jgi:surface antigen
MAGRSGCRAFHSLPYSGTGVASIRLALTLTLAFGMGGCAVSGSLFSKSSPTEAHAYTSEEVTGSVERASATAVALPAESDLVFTRKAVVDALTHGAKEISSPWENPATGARGTVTPVASNYTKDGLTCRDFLASYVRREGAEVWLQGQACRPRQGAWEVRSMHPWSRT